MPVSSSPKKGPPGARARPSLFTAPAQVTEIAVRVGGLGPLQAAEVSCDEVV